MTVGTHARVEGPVPVEALAWFRRKGFRVGFAHQDVWREEHAYAFTAAKVMREDVLAAMRDEIARALEDGLPYEEFAKRIEPRLQALGWWGQQSVTDPVTGRVVEVSVPARLHRIFETNMRTAAAAGQWHRIERTKRLRPYLLYQLGPSREHREEHVSWAGTVLPVDHPWWDTHAPPNGWGCKCRIVQLSERQLETLRKTGIRGPDGATIPIRETPPSITTRTYVNPRTGVASEVPEGIDPGWEYNVGKVRRQADGAPPPPPVTPPLPRTAEETLRGITGLAGDPTDPRIQDRLHRLLGNDVDPASINRMVDPPAGFRTKNVAVSFRDGVSKDTYVMELHATIVDDDATGEVAAEVSRTITRGADGSLTAYHGLLVVEDERQASGLGSHLLRNQLQSYDEWGVRQITLDAAWTGRYVWSRMGFEMEEFDPTTLPSIRQRYANFLERHAGMSAASAAIAASQITSAHDLAHHDPDPDVRIPVGYGEGGQKLPGAVYASPPPYRHRRGPRPERVQNCPAGKAFLLTSFTEGGAPLLSGRVDLRTRGSESRQRYTRAIGYDDGT